MATTNGKVLTLEDREEIRIILREISSETSSQEHGGTTIKDLFRSTFLKQSCILIFCWCSAILAIYVLTLNVSALNGNIFVNHALGTFIELPAITIIYLLSDYLGLHNTTICLK